MGVGAGQRHTHRHTHTYTHAPLHIHTHPVPRPIGARTPTPAVYSLHFSVPSLHPTHPSTPPNWPPQTSYSACPHAARKGHAETLRVLLAAGANPWLPDADGYSAYDYALDHAKPPAVVAALLEGDPRFGEVQRGFQVGVWRWGEGAGDGAR